MLRPARQPGDHRVARRRRARGADHRRRRQRAFRPAAASRRLRQAGGAGRSAARARRWAPRCWPPSARAPSPASPTPPRRFAAARRWRRAPTRTAPTTSPTRASGGALPRALRARAMIRAAGDVLTLANARGDVGDDLPFGATLVELRVPDRDGQLGNVVLGLDDPAAYARQNVFLGAICGRVANRIRDARFTLGGRDLLPRRQRSAAPPARRCRAAGTAPTGPWRPASAGRRGGRAAPSFARRGRRVSRRRRGAGDLHAHRRQRAAHRDERDHRSADAHQPDQPQPTGTWPAPATILESPADGRRRGLSPRAIRSSPPAPSNRWPARRSTIRSPQLVSARARSQLRGRPTSRDRCAPLRACRSRRRDAP